MTGRMQSVSADTDIQTGNEARKEIAALQWVGLSDEEAAQRLVRYGFNEVPSAQERKFWRIALDVLKEPMLLLLIGTGGVYLLLGDPAEAAVLLVAIFGIIGITLYQERKTERALHALRDLSSPRALVIRQSMRKRIAGREVVPGDLVIISEGDRIPADGIILESRNVQIDESLLTGESLPVTKTQGAPDVELGRPGGDNTPNAFSGTLVVKGRGIIEVRATGLASELGKIGTSLAGLRPDSTQIQKETNNLVKIFAVIGVLLCGIVVLVFSYTHGNWLQGVLAGLTLAISMVPEEFPVVLTIFLAMGAWRMSRQRVLTRRMPAIETLGAATVLCVDKTGTLTMNRMSVQTLFSGGQLWNVHDDRSAIPEGFHEAVEYSILASSRDPFDPMEKAFLTLGQDFLQSTEHLHADWTLAREYPLSPVLLVMARAWNVPGAATRYIAAKGAPEAVAQLCRLSAEEGARLKIVTEKMASQGLRVLGVAKATVEGDLPAEQEMIPFQLVGLVGLADPVRPSVPAALQECYRAGIRVIMITGDYPVTAQSIAAQIGLHNPDRTITGAELEKMDDTQLKQLVRDVNVFARVVPEQKLRLVNALKASGEVVAMTGDGVNDAPALKAADIGIAMGNRGTDVARESAALVLLDDDFSSIVNAIRSGRRIYDNLKKATAFVLAVHVPIAGVTLVPLLLGWPLLLIPINVVFLELIIDPACSIAFEAEPEEPNVMARPPRNRNERLFERKRVLLSLLQGFGVFITTLAVYGFFLHHGHSETDSRALGFSTLVVGNLALIFTNRSWTRTIWNSVRGMNTSLWAIAIGTCVALSLVLYVPPLTSLFHFSAVHPSNFFIAVFAGCLGVLWFEALKLVTGKHLRHGPAEAGK